jgi:hypothetical protein
MHQGHLTASIYNQQIAYKEDRSCCTYRAIQLLQEQSARTHSYNISNQQSSLSCQTRWYAKHIKNKNSVNIILFNSAWTARLEFNDTF